MQSCDTAFLEKLKDMYCYGNKDSCARYMVFKAIGPKYVTDDLEPYMSNKAMDIIEKHEQ
jgi:hypothetical protein